MTGIASFHLVRERRGPRALARLATDRRPLRQVPGLAFWRLLGTGEVRTRRRPSTSGAPRCSPSGSASTTSTCSFDRSAIADRWTRAEEAWHVRLRARRRSRIVARLRRAPRVASGIGRRTDRRHHPGQRALAAWRAFTRASSTVNAELQRATGLLGALGMGEAPVGRLGTFSLWRSVDDVRAFARSAAPCRRHAPQPCRGAGTARSCSPGSSRTAATGTWDGVDPLRP